MAVSASAQVVNQALAMSGVGGGNTTVTGAWPAFDDQTAAGKSANSLYGPCVQTIMRQFQFDFERNTVVLETTTNPAPYPWSIEYKWPTNAIQIWQLSPQSEDDPNDPLPVNYVVANNLVDGTRQRVIQTDLEDAQAIYSNYPDESTWDATFREAVVRLLASEFAIALGGKPDTSQVLLQSGAAFEKIAETRAD